MYCTKCGKEAGPHQKYCIYCGEALFSEKRFCPNCGYELDFTQIVCPHCGYHTPPVQPLKKTSKSRVLAGLLGIFLGGLGVHNFYLGHTSKAVIQVVLTMSGFLTFGLTSMISEVWGFVEGILILIGNVDKDGDGYPLQ